MWWPICKQLHSHWQWLYIITNQCLCIYWKFALLNLIHPQWCHELLGVWDHPFNPFTSRAGVLACARWVVVPPSPGLGHGEARVPDRRLSSEVWYTWAPHPHSVHGGFQPRLEAWRSRLSQHRHVCADGHKEGIWNSCAGGSLGVELHPLALLPLVIH